MPADNALTVIVPDWDAPASVVSFTTTTMGGFSQGDCATFNLGAHVGDNPEHVAKNRQRLQQFVGDNVQLCWLNQTHSDIVVDANDYVGVVEGDASVATQRQQACLVMTADCLPVLLCDTAGKRVAALHCGWKGLQQDLIGKSILQHFANERVIAWLGPAIGQRSYEVDEGLYQRFLSTDAQYAKAFEANRPGHYLMNLYRIARQQLHRVGVENIFGGDFDTFSDTRFFSHRRSAQSGRMASIIYLH